MKYVRMPRSLGDNLIQIGGEYVDPKVQENNNEFQTVGVPNELGERLVAMGGEYTNALYKSFSIVPGTHTTIECKNSDGDIIANGDSVDVDDVCTVTVESASTYYITNLVISGGIIQSTSINTLTKRVFTIKASSNISISCGNAGNALYDYAITHDSNSTIVLKNTNNEIISTGSDRLVAGGKYKVVASADTGYNISSLTYNTEDIDNNTEITVNTDVALVITAAQIDYTLSGSATNATVAVSRDGTVITAATAIHYGDELVVVATAAEGYSISKVTINDVEYDTPTNYTVTGDTNIIATGVAE